MATDRPLTWFRFYSETLRDRKLERIARVTGHPKALLMGVWVTLLALANDSPERGVLLLTDDIHLVLDDLCLETGLDAETLSPIIERFLDMNMLSFEGDVYYITNWDKRQFKSDDSSERVRRYRERKEAESGGECNDDETLQERDGNAPETETETETDIVFREMLDRWAELFPNKPQPKATTVSLRKKLRTRMKVAEFRNGWLASMRRASQSTFCNNGGWCKFGWFLENDENWRKALDGDYDDKPKPKTGNVSANGWNIPG